MSLFDKHRFEVWSQTQHPLKHTLSDFSYANPSLPGVSDVNSALNWLVKVLYPNSKAAVATPAALPAVGNTLNDYRVVLDDGDGKQAGYRWEQREGELSASWHKVFDFDWSTDSILAALYDVTQDKFVIKFGRQDLDASGNIITGTYAGQRIYGGTQATQNLTLEANSGDGTGAATGYVQTGSTFRPTVGGVYSLGTNSERFLDGFFNGIVRVQDLFFQTGQITDISGQISFDNENLVTTGNITGAIGYYTSSVEVGPLAGNALILAPGSITDESGAISFGNENLTTTGTITAATNSVLADITFATGSITSLTATISFGTNNLNTSGNITGGILTGTSLDVDNVNINGNTVSITNTNGNLILTANGTGIIDLQKNVTSLDITATGTVIVTGQLNADNLRLDANVLSATNTNGSVTIQPNGTGIVEVTSSVLPNADATNAIGSASLRFTSLFLSGSIGDGTTSVSQATLQSLRDINVGVGVGFALFWDGSKWAASLPDTEITHSSLSGLTTGDAGHTQFVVLAGRAGGQDVQGGTAASENLTLESTAHATKGSVFTKDNFKPFTNASYSGGWSGTDLGGASNYFNDIYTKGVHKGLRLENYTSGTLPSSSAQNVGRVVYSTDDSKIYVDTGSSFIAVAGTSKYLSDTSWDGVATTQDFTVSADISDARNAIWAIHDNANDFERIYCTIKAISATQVRVVVSPALPAGSYRLIGLE